MRDSAETLAIIGGGAAGLTAAIAAVQRASDGGRALEVVVFEKDDRVGRSILATGNGRCNFSNAHLDRSLYYNADFVSQVFDGLIATTDDPDPVHRFFRSLGLEWRQEADGRQYPAANKASVVLDVLRAAAAQGGVEEQCDCEIAAIDSPRGKGAPFTLRMKNGILKRADAVVVAVGGRAFFALDAPMVPRRPTRPVLGPLALSPQDTATTRELDNIRVRVHLALQRVCGDGQEPRRTIAENRGELLFRKYGVSGICVFDLSRMAEPGDYLVIDFLDKGGMAASETFLKERYALLVKRFGPELSFCDMLRGLLLPRVSDALLKCQDIHPRDSFEGEHIPLLTALLSAFVVRIEGVADGNSCQVRRGGFAVDAFDPRTLEAREAQRFFAAGEALDVDGPCGGYNLHWAWASGLVAGRSAADAALNLRPFKGDSL